MKISKFHKSMKTSTSSKITWELLLLKPLSKIWKRLNKTNSSKLKKESIPWLTIFNQTKRLERRRWSIWWMTFKTLRQNVVLNRNIKTKARSGWRVPKLLTLSKTTTLIQTISNSKWSSNKSPKNQNTDLLCFVLFFLKSFILRIEVDLSLIMKPENCTLMDG